MPLQQRVAATRAEASSFDGARVALLEARHSNTLANLVETYGGRPYAVPALRVEPIASDRVDRLIQGIARGRFSVLIFQTGIAAERLFEEAERRGMLAQVCDRLARSMTVCRGPKPSAVLARHGVKPALTVGEPYTTTELLNALSTIDISRKYVALLHYGEQNRELTVALRTRGARLAEFLLYEWLLPLDTSGLHEMVGTIIAGGVDAIAFTNQMQIRNLHRVAGQTDRGEALLNALAQDVVVASIGQSCTHQLMKFGIQPRVVPGIPKMRPLISALADYLRDARITTARASSLR